MQQKPSKSQLFTLPMGMIKTFQPIYIAYFVSNNAEDGDI